MMEGEKTEGANHMEQYRFDPYTGQPLNPQRPVNNRPWLGGGYQPGGQVQAPTQPPARQDAPNVIFRPVASFDEAKAVPTDFSGALTIMPDWAHGYIYAKALGDNGAPVFRTYRDVDYSPVQTPPPQTAAEAVPAIAYAPLEELEHLREEVKALRQELTPAKAPAKETAEKPAGKGNKL